ncbi:MAG: YcfL family protein [Kiritimatiellae bacterium]|jgi:uncharacterized protein YcfL|nr:YcfL family protein [Kiritimatiellia bacterium]NLD89695.1 YcfL family protein [Lentisphaerota bacterium]HPC19269.1 YcfL family protein [Kiritimatiellia bacterium]HQN80890.1 YcfL family protein [Kiritimatiellia bacterium]HQQ60682.1 YcfL family protein [Kiritimatiellia bacterium]
MNMRMVLLAAALAGAVLAGGCISSAPQEVEFDDGIYTVKSHSLTLRQHVRLTRRTVDFNKNGFLQAQIEAVNLGRKDVQFQYRFRWLNEQKMLIPAATAIWKPVSVGARSTEYFTSTAPTTDARDFFMEVRFVHDSTRW